MLLGQLKMATIATSLASFYPYVLAIVSTVFGTKQEWIATTTRNRRQDPLLKWIWPHIFLIFLTIFSLIIGWYEPTNFWATLFNTGWAIWNMYLLVLFLTGENRIVVSTSVQREVVQQEVMQERVSEALPQGVTYAVEI